MEKDMYSFIDILYDKTREELREELREEGREEVFKQIEELGNKIGFGSAEFLRFIKLPSMEKNGLLKVHNIIK